MNEKLKEKIVSVLRKNPMGLTISNIAKLVDSNRTTIPKYLYQLKGEKKVLLKEIGPAKVFFFNKRVS
jgi:predicted Zn-ribbon and HTH transcriptional regulator